MWGGEGCVCVCEGCVCVCVCVEKKSVKEHDFLEYRAFFVAKNTHNWVKIVLTWLFEAKTKLRFGLDI